MSESASISRMQAQGKYVLSIMRKWKDEVIFIITIISKSSEDKLDFHLFLLIEFLHQYLDCFYCGHHLQRLAYSPYLLHPVSSLSKSVSLEIVVGQEQGLLKFHVSMFYALLAFF